MKQSTLANWLKLMILGVGLCGLLIYAVAVPALGQVVAVAEDGLYDHCFWPWLVLIWATGLPIVAALVLAWRIAGNIGADKSFSLDNGRYLKWISALAAGDGAFFLLGNVVYLFMGMNHPGILLFSLLVVFVAIAVAVAAAALSRLVTKAAQLQEQSDWTI